MSDGKEPSKQTAMERKRPKGLYEQWVQWTMCSAAYHVDKVGGGRKTATLIKTLGLGQSRLQTIDTGSCLQDGRVDAVVSG